MDITHIKDHSRDRYHSIAISSVWELDVVRNARALVVGAGALGNEVTKNLTLMGLKFMAIVDRDTIEVANLTRSVFFRETDHGRNKTEVLSERLLDLNPEVDIVPLNGDVEEVVGLGLVRRMDMIISCLDNRLARQAVNRLCQKLAKPWVDGAMENLMGDVTVYLPDEGPCYECTLTRVDLEIIAQAQSCRGIALNNIARGKVPTTSTMGSIIAAIQVQEALKILHNNQSQPVAAKKLVVNCDINDFYLVTGERKEDCGGHFRFGEITEVSEWTRDNTSARDILARFERDANCKGHIRLGRDIVIALECPACSVSEELEEPIRPPVRLEKAVCPACGEIRELKTTNVIKETDHYADRPLNRLAVPWLDILEVRGREGIIWYEMTGDLKAFPDSLG